MSLKKGMPKSSKNPDDVHGGSGTVFSRKNLPSLQGIQVKATETSSTHPAREMEKEADSFERKEVSIKAKILRVPFSPSTTATAAVSRGWFAVAWNNQKKGNRQGECPSTLPIKVA